MLSMKSNTSKQNPLGIEYEMCYTKDKLNNGQTLTISPNLNWKIILIDQ